MAITMSNLVIVVSILTILGLLVLSRRHRAVLVYSETCPACEEYMRTVLPAFPWSVCIKKVSVNDSRALESANIARNTVKAVPMLVTEVDRKMTQVPGDIWDADAVSRYLRAKTSPMFFACLR